MLLYGINKDSNNNNLYMVTTSDFVNPDNLEYLVKENSVFNIPYPKNQNGFKYWYNHSDNKIYYPNDNIVVYNSIYLEAIYNQSNHVLDGQEAMEKHLIKIFLLLKEILEIKIINLTGKQFLMQ